MRFATFSRLAAAAACATLALSPAQAETMRATGRVPLSKDPNSTRTLAEMEARKEVVRRLLASIVDADDVSAVADKDIADLADQIPSSAIINREPSVVDSLDPKVKGKIYQLAIEVTVDGAWLTQRIKDLRIQLPSQKAAVSGTRIMLVLDSYIGVASDSSKPQSEVIEYRKEVGSSFSDKSINAYSEKEKAAASQSDKSAVSGSSSSAAGFSNGYGSAAGRSRSSGSAASSSKSSAAYSRNVDAVSKADVQAETHDNTYFRKEVVYQGGIGKSGSANKVDGALKGYLYDYGIIMEASTTALNRFQVERFEELQKGPWQDFLGFAASSTIDYVAGGELVITKEGGDPDSRQYFCSGTLSLSGFSTTNTVAGGLDGFKEASASGDSEEKCEARLVEILSKSLADQLGPRIQDNRRDQMLAQEQAIANQNRMATEGGVYNLIFRSSALNFQSMRAITGVLNGLGSIQKPFVTVSTGPKEVVYRVTYKSSDGQDLGMAVLGALADQNPAYGDSPLPTMSGQTVTVCLMACQ
jgi:hypothetical protein